jgi:mono/diheme cytochrome c family protein
MAAMVSALVLAGAQAHARAAGAPGADASTIEVWVRKAGATGATGAGESAGRDQLQVLKLDSLPLADARRIDVQYHGAFVYRGIDLQTLIERFGPPASTDLALLHFANGMQIPLAFRNVDLMRSLSPFLARGIRLRPGRPVQLGRFPKISRPRAGFVDVRPITFAGNKLVVGSRNHPDVPETAREVLSPWEQADSLTGIELVSQAAYDAQFDVDPDPGVKAGNRLFAQSCQFCHGVRRTGAAFGWDFVEPTPVAEYRGERNLFLHVKYKPIDAAARGIQMPALSYMTEDDAKSIWLWLKAVADHPLRPYAP